MLPALVRTGPGTLVREADYYVDAVNGSDADSGSRLKPWKTLKHAAETTPDLEKTVSVVGEHAGFTSGRALLHPMHFRADGDAATTSLLKLENARNYFFQGFDIFMLEIHGSNFNCCFVECPMETGTYEVEKYALNLSYRNRLIRFIRCPIRNSWGCIGGGHIPANLVQNRSKDIYFIECPVELAAGDLFTFASWERVHLIRCPILQTGINNPKGEPHTDHIQMTGDCRQVYIEGCEILQYWEPELFTEEGTGGGQMIFLQVELGASDKAYLFNNLVATNLKSTAVAAKNKGMSNYIAANNTFWCPNFTTADHEMNGAAGAQTDSISINNIQHIYREASGSSCATRHHGLYGVNPAAGLGTGEAVHAEPGFKDMSGGYTLPNDYHLLPESPAKNAGSNALMAAFPQLRYDKDGTLRDPTKPSIGCYE